MNTLQTTRSIRNILISAAAVSAITLPIFASASVNLDSSDSIRVAYDSTELASNRGQAELYEKLQNASRKICGSADIYIGSLHQSVGRSECFEDTLTAAVERLDHPGVSALHSE